METNNEPRWVSERMAHLDPAWKPDYAHGRALLDASLAKRRRSWPLPALAAAAVVCMTVVAFPQTRALAQQLWVHFVLNRVDVVRVDFSDLPLHAQVTSRGSLQKAQDLDDAERKAGFRPYLPEPGLLPANPSLTVVGATTVEQVVHVGELQAALNKVGASDVRVPAEWEGARLHATVGPMVNVGYPLGDPDGIGILEAKPIEVSVPVGFPLQLFTELAFRSIGRSRVEAQSLAQRFVTNPAWMLGIPADEVANIEQVSLRNGTAMLIEETRNDDGSAGRVTVLRSTKERIYCVLTNSRQLALTIAEALP
jgi:hypothetical protein